LGCKASRKSKKRKTLLDTELPKQTAEDTKLNQPGTEAVGAAEEGGTGTAKAVTV
jgi:hypothetical protein